MPYFYPTWPTQPDIYEDFNNVKIYTDCNIKHTGEVPNNSCLKQWLWYCNLFLGLIGGGSWGPNPMPLSQSWGGSYAVVS